MPPTFVRFALARVGFAAGKGKTSPDATCNGQYGETRHTAHMLEVLSLLARGDAEHCARGTALKTSRGRKLPHKTKPACNKQTLTQRSDHRKMQAVIYGKLTVLRLHLRQQVGPSIHGIRCILACVCNPLQRWPRGPYFVRNTPRHGLESILATETTHKQLACVKW